MKTLSKIIKTNLQRRGKNILGISMSLLDVLLEKTPLETKLVELSQFRDPSGFVPIPLIPADVKEFLSLDAIVIENSRTEDDDTQIRRRLPDANFFIESLNSRKKNLRLENLEKAFNEYELRECEFVDSFRDEASVKTRAQRLSVLLFLRNEHEDRDFLEKAYEKLRDLDPKFDLVSGSFQAFYEQLRWYARAGEVRGCIHN